MSDAPFSLRLSAGVELHGHEWLPEPAPRAAVAVLHGLFEHSGRYVELGRRLAAAGFAALTVDYRGHGRSPGQRGHLRRFDDLLDDAAALVERAGAVAHGRPLLLFGHSLGAVVAGLLATARGTPLAGLVLESTPLRLTRRMRPWLRLGAILLDWIAPRLRVGRMGFRLLSRDPAAVPRFRDDPLVYHDGFTVHTSAEVFRGLARLRRSLPKLTAPVLVLHGTADAIADARGARELVDRVGSADKTLKLYKGLYHDLLSEPEREAVFGDLLAWLEARV